jgi:predicted restriction endonuclease
MSNVSIHEMLDFMPVYWTDGVNTVRLVPEQDQTCDKVDSQSRKTNPPGRKLVEILRIIRDTIESKELKTLYKNKCQVCGKPLLTRNGFYSEVHHLKPLGDNGDDKKSNMVVVCPNHHALFDYGAIAIVPETLMVISFDGHKIGPLVIESSHIIDNQFIDYQYRKFVIEKKNMMWEG